MDKLTISKKNLSILKNISEGEKILLGGKILNYIDLSDDEVREFIEKCKLSYNQKIKDKEALSKELVTEKRKLVNALEEITDSNKQIKKYANELEATKKEAEDAKNIAINDLDILRKKKQIETFDNVVKFMIYSIVGGMIFLNILFAVTLYNGVENQILMTTWASTMTMIFTNAFSIIATIMGVKKIIQENGTIYDSNVNKNNNEINKNYVNNSNNRPNNASIYSVEDENEYNYLHNNNNETNIYEK